MVRTYYRPQGEARIFQVLNHVRQEIIRDDLDGLEHVEALLRLRGVDPETLDTPHKWPKAFAQNELRRAIRRVLADGPKTSPEIARAIADEREGLSYDRVRRSVNDALYKMKLAGLLAHEGRVWSM